MSTGLQLWDALPAPAVRTSATSQAAAEHVTPALGRLRQLVLDYIREHGPCTDEQIIDAMHFGKEGTARARRVELVRMGLVKDSGTTRRTRSGRAAVAWRAV